MNELSPEAQQVLRGARKDTRLTGRGSGEIRERMAAGLIRSASAAESRERIVVIVTRKGEELGRTLAATQHVRGSGPCPSGANYPHRSTAECHAEPPATTAALATRQAGAKPSEQGGQISS